jgi:hypothetical protein
MQLNWLDLPLPILVLRSRDLPFLIALRIVDLFTPQAAAAVARL